MTPSEEIETWIARHGSCRDALNVALAKLDIANNTITRLNKIILRDQEFKREIAERIDKILEETE